MDEITDNIGGLSLNAKEWRPGLGFATTPTASAAPSGSSSSMTASPLRHHRSTGSIESSGSGGGWNNAFSGRSSSWGESSSQAIDVNGTHYFGSALSTSWETSRQHPHPSAAQSSLNDNASHISHATIPSPNHQQYRTSHRTTSTNALSLPVEEYHHYRDLSLQSAREMDPNDPRHKLVPPSFCHAYCLDIRHAADTTSGNTITQQRSSFGYPTSTFRVTSATDGNLYCLRRIDSVRGPSHKIVHTVMQQWLSSGGREGGHAPGGSGFDHPGVVRWYKCFLSQRALFFVHEYHPGAVTLRERFFGGVARGSGWGAGVPLPEPLIWSCLVQLVSAVRAVHGNGLAVRTLQLNHILCTQEGVASSSSSGPYGLPRLRLRINCVGVVDVLEFEARRSLDEFQCADMRALGCILLSMTTGDEVTISDVFRGGGAAQGQALAEYFGFVQQNYSREMYTVLHSLLDPSAPPAGVRGVAAGMAARVFDELDGAHGSIDVHSSSLMGIYESGRALRLLLKLAFVNERPEFGIDKNWSESGDCYILKLFRDFVFHQADGAGRPVMDLGHVVSSLNKLDAADEEQIILASRDGKNIMVVSFADVAWCLEKAYQELCSNSVPIPSMS